MARASYELQIYMSPRVLDVCRGGHVGPKRSAKHRAAIGKFHTSAKLPWEGDSCFSGAPVRRGACIHSALIHSSIATVLIHPARSLVLIYKCTSPAHSESSVLLTRRTNTRCRHSHFRSIRLSKNPPCLSQPSSSTATQSNRASSYSSKDPLLQNRSRFTRPMVCV